MSTEDFTTYTEVDPNSRISRTSSRVTFAGIVQSESAYVYKDEGSGHFSGDFEHLLDVRITNMLQSCIIEVWALWNAVGDRTENESSNGVMLQMRWDGGKRAYLLERYNNNWYASGNFAIGENTTYYIKIDRTGSTLRARFYSDAERTNLLGTVSLTLQSVVAYRYIYAAESCTFATGSQGISGYVENLDLQEAGQVYEINVDAAVKSSAPPATETTYNIEKDASISSSGLVASESVYNVLKDAIIKGDATVEIEAIIEKIIEAVASVSVSATPELQSVFNILKNAEIKVSAAYTLESLFNLYPDAVIYATAIPEVSIGVVKKTKIFLMIGNIAIQLSGD